MKKKNATMYITQAAAVAALYAALTYAASFVGIAYGNIQFRFSEALTVLALFTPAAVPGLTVGCFLGNLASPYGIADIIVGSAATFLAALLTYKTRHIKICGYPFLSVVFPVLFNAVLVGAEIVWFMPEGASAAAFAISAGEVAIGEAAVCVLLGVPLRLFLIKSGASKRIFGTSQQLSRR